MKNWSALTYTYIWLHLKVEYQPMALLEKTKRFLKYVQWAEWKQHLWEDNLCERKAKEIYCGLRKNTGTRDHYIITTV